MHLQHSSSASESRVGVMRCSDPFMNFKVGFVEKGRLARPQLRDFVYNSLKSNGIRSKL